MNQDDFCSVLETKIVNSTAVQTTYKIKGGNYIVVKSVFQNNKDFKEAIYSAAVESTKQKMNA